MNGQDRRSFDEKIISFVHEVLHTNRHIRRQSITHAVVDKFFASRTKIDETVSEAIRSVCPYSFDIKCELDLDIESLFIQWSSGIAGRSVLSYDGSTVRSVSASSGIRLGGIDCWNISVEIEEEAALFALTLPAGTEMKKTRG